MVSMAHLKCRSYARDRQSYPIQAQENQDNLNENISAKQNCWHTMGTYQAL